MLTGRLRPRRPLATLILPDDGSGDDLAPRLRGDGNPNALLHLVLDDGSCRNCGARHFDEPTPVPAANAGGEASQKPETAAASEAEGPPSNKPDDGQGEFLRPDTAKPKDEAS